MIFSSKNNPITIFLFLITMLFSIFSCSSSKKTNNTNFAYQYQTQSKAPKVKSRIHHIDQDSSDIYTAIATKHLSVDETRQHQLMIRYLLFSDVSGKTLMDSLHTFINLSKQKAGYAPLIVKKTMLLPTGKNYLLKLEIIDRIAKKILRKSLLINKKNNWSEQNFLLTQTTSKNPDKSVLFDTYLEKGKSINISYQKQKNKELIVEHFAPTKDLPLPPFITKQKPERYRPDTVFRITKNLTLEKLGLYLIKNNDTARTGIPILCIDANYPKLTQATDLVESLRYITQKKEYQQLKQTPKPKKAVDNFWLSRAGSTHRGKILIAEFYGRVQRANAFFTTYKAGWKTDRGLIFIIYGQPDAVFLTPSSERWEYTTRNQQRNLVFVFNRHPAPFTDNRWLLARDSYFEDSWHQAVYEWRKGIIRNKSN